MASAPAVALILEIAPRMVAAFTLAGLVQAVVPAGSDRALDGCRARVVRGLIDRHDLGQYYAGRADDTLSGDRFAL